MYKHILVAVDPAHGEVGARILAVARHLAGAEGRITLLTVLEPVPTYVANYIPPEIGDRRRADARAALAELVRGAGVAPRLALRTGHPANAILEEAEAAGCDAIVIGSHRPDYRDYLIGSTAARVVRHAPVTVVVERTTPVRT